MITVCDPIEQAFIDHVHRGVRFSVRRIADRWQVVLASGDCDYASDEQEAVELGCWMIDADKAEALLNR